MLSRGGAKFAKTGSKLQYSANLDWASPTGVALFSREAIGAISNQLRRRPKSLTERLNPRFSGFGRFQFGLVALFRVDSVVAEDGAVEADDGCVVVVDQDDDFGSGVVSAGAEVQHAVAVAE